MEKQDEKSLLIHEIVNIIIHIPAMIAISFWGLLIIGILGLKGIASPFEYMITMFPITIPLISCVAGTIRFLISFYPDLLSTKSPNT